MIKKNNLLSLTLAIFLFTLGCNKDEEDGVAGTAQIVLSPENIRLNDDETKTLYLAVQPKSQFQWNVSSKPDWLEISQTSGSIHQDIIALQLTPNPEGLNQGKHYGEIEIITNGAGKAKVDVELCVDANPVLNLSTEDLVYLENEAEKTITISNTGIGFLNWEFETLPSWISVEPSIGVLDQGENVEVSLSVQRNGQDVGTLREQLVLSNNSEENPANIDVVVEVPEMTIIKLSKPVIHFNYFDTSKTFFIKNEGNVALNWTWDNNNNPFIELNHNSGVLSKGDSIEITMHIDRSNLLNQVYDLEIFIQNNTNQSTSLPVQINHFKDDKWNIEGEVIDAEYDRTNDVLVLVTEGPNELQVFNFSNNTVQKVALNIPPKCVAVGLNGDYAAVGHNGSFSYLNLSTMEVSEIYSVTANAFDIVLAPNNWVYVFPQEGQWNSIRCVQLSNGAESPNTGRSIRERTKVKLHPSGNYIYGADNGLSPSDVEKYDLTNGTAEYLYDSPYHGDYNINGEIWISDDGNRLFAKSRNVFKSSTNEESDMTYNGQLSGENNIKTLDHSSAAQKIYTVNYTGGFWESTPNNQIRKYNSEFLTFEGTIELPGFLIPDGNGGGNFYDSEGHFGFFNASGTKYHVLVKAADGSPAQNQWAIASIDVE